MHKRRSLIAFAAWAFAFPTFGYAQTTADYPSKPVRVIVPAGTGGGTDITSRMYAYKLSEQLKRSFVIENRPGGGGSIAYAYVAQQPADGYTLMTAASSYVFSPALYPNFPFDPAKSFAPISLMNRTASTLVVHPSLPVKSIKDLIALAKAKPGALNCAINVGATNHLFIAYFASAANIKVTFIPYKGGPQADADIVAGHVDMLMGNLSSYLPPVKAGKLRALAVTTAQRSPALPNVPTIAESGIPGFEASSWHGLLAPAGTPPAIITKLSEEIAKAVRSPEIVQKLADDGAVPVGNTPEQFRKIIAEDAVRWTKVVKDSGMRVE